jgi:hypothetical protein
MIAGNKLFSTKDSNLKQVFCLPDFINVINEKHVQPLKSFEIPTTVTSLDENCFYGCNELEHLTIPESVKYIPHDIFMRTYNMNNLTFKSKEFVLNGNRMFYTIDNCLHSIELLNFINKINGKEVEIKPLQTFTIPSNVTKLSDNCFAHCNFPQR